MTAQSPHLSTLIDGIAHLHASCILYDGTLATFLPPLSHLQLYGWWEDRVQEVTSEQRQIIVFLSEVSQRTTGKEDSVRPPWIAEGRDWPGITTDENTARLEVSGVVSLSAPFSQTGPFRAVVQKLFVSPLHRRRGIARRMMARLETVAMQLGRWNLMLDTTVGTEAESVYPRLGYERLGVVKEYGYSPVDGSLVDEVWFWKDLRKMKRLEEQ